MVLAAPPAILSTERGLLCQGSAVQISEPVSDWGVQSQALVTGWNGEVCNEWRLQAAMKWRDSKFTRAWDAHPWVPGYGDPDGLLIHPMTVPVTVTIFGDVGQITAQFDWAAGVCDVSLDGFTDPNDYFAWLNWYESGDPRADFSTDGFLDPLDFGAFVNSFEGRP